MSTPFLVPPVEKSVLVQCDPARAFAAFTAEIAQWWPMQTHSVAEAQTRSVAIESRVGGRIYETAADGTESEWGRVLAWSPPDGFSMTWHPGRPADPHTIVELSFAAEGSATRVRLVHRGGRPSAPEPRPRARATIAAGTPCWSAISAPTLAAFPEGIPLNPWVQPTLDFCVALCTVYEITE